MRTFIAIELPQDIRTHLAGLQNELKKAGADVKWVEEANIHITLKFLGEVNDQQLAEVKKVLEGAAYASKQFSMRVSSLGAFPKVSFPKVIWVGIDKGDAETQHIVQDLEDRLVRLGIPQEQRPFSSHITIGRTRSELNRVRLAQELDSLAGQLAGQTQEFNVTKITLFKSTLTPKGPLYEVIKEAPLKTP